MAIRESRENWRITLRKYPSSPARGCHFEGKIFSGPRSRTSIRHEYLPAGFIAVDFDHGTLPPSFASDIESKARIH